MPPMTTGSRGEKNREEKAAKEHRSARGTAVVGDNEFGGNRDSDPDCDGDGDGDGGKVLLESWPRGRLVATKAESSILS